MIACPTCGDSFDNKHGMRIHHTKVHDEPLDNNVCNKCGESFYDDRSDRTLCNSCERVIEKPDGVEIPDGETWEDLSAYQRYYYRNKEDEKSRVKDRKQSIEDWYHRVKEEAECGNCGEEHPATLEHHHRDPQQKEKSIADMVNLGYSKQKIKTEMDKCTVLCANCHAKKHSSI